MKVNPVVYRSYQKVIEKQTILVPTVKQVEINKMVEETKYEVELTQEQLDVIVAICGNVLGGGPVRKLTNSIYKGLKDYATLKSNDNIRYKFESYFSNKLSQWGSLLAEEEIK